MLRWNTTAYVLTGDEFNQTRESDKLLNRPMQNDENKMKATEKGRGLKSASGIVCMSIRINGETKVTGSKKD